jgi:hypothetical protein
VILKLIIEKKPPGTGKIKVQSFGKSSGVIP